MCSDPGKPILDWDADKEQCLCHAHPCDNLDGVAHSCQDPKFPILNYRKEIGTDGTAKDVCECIASHHKSILFIADVCRDKVCKDTKFPLMDWNNETGKCECHSHPCWSDAGKLHQCSDPAKPHLTYTYSKDGSLQCLCKERPENYGKFIAWKCRGLHCEDPATPLLDWIERTDECGCLQHPCDNVDGVKHECKDPKFPIMNYRFETTDGTPKAVCECLKSHHREADEL